MRNNTLRNRAGSTANGPYEPLSARAARARRTGREFDGWLATRMRSGAAARRRAESDNDRAGIHGR
jgi:hypothetical protein